MKLTTTAKRRLNKLIEFMESLPESANNHFAMSSWLHHEGDHEHAVAKDGTITKRTLMGCGTSACAAGWAATIPEFKKAGFRYHYESGFSIAPEEFFEVDDRLAGRLFYSWAASTPKEWAANARRLIRKA